ncbi:MAG: hypothetical protein ACLTER_11015 [Ruminococcus sp.]
MCKAIKEMLRVRQTEEGEQEGRLEGRQEGRLEGRQEGRLEGTAGRAIEEDREGRLEGQDEMATLSEKLILRPCQRAVKSKHRSGSIEISYWRSLVWRENGTKSCEYMISVRREVAAGIGVNR